MSTPMPFGNITNFRIPKKSTRKTTPSYPPVILQPHHLATSRNNIPGGAVDDDDDDDIFIGESVSAEELVSRARAKAEARNEIIVVDDDEDSPPRNINPPQLYHPPIIHQPQPVTTKPSASNQSLIDLSLDDDDGMGMDTSSSNAINDDNEFDALSYWQRLLEDNRHNRHNVEQLVEKTPPGFGGMMMGMGGGLPPSLLPPPPSGMPPTFSGSIAPSAGVHEEARRTAEVKTRATRDDLNKALLRNAEISTKHYFAMRNVSAH